MEVSAMPDAVDHIAYAVGGAFVSPGPGAAELMLALLVALAFAASAVRTWLEGHKEPWRRGRP
jgi:hypothetical protein